MAGVEAIELVVVVHLNKNAKDIAFYSLDTNFGSLLQGLEETS